jgi:mannobiose 2-epimerase
MRRLSYLFLALTLSACAINCENAERTVADSELEKYTEPEFWRHQALTEIVPFWEQTIDRENGGFYTNVMFDGSVYPKGGKFPRMQSRIVYGYSVAYLLSGDEKYLALARHGLDYLTKYGWDREHGGWYLHLDKRNKPKKYFYKNLFDQTYGNLGPVMYYFTTGDKDVLAYVEKTHALIQKHTWDPVYGGYFAEVGPAWHKVTATKSFNSQIDTCSAYLIYYYLATGKRALLGDLVRITDIAKDKMIDPKTGFVGETFNEDWRSTERWLWVGHNLKTGWILMRAYRLTGNKKYADAATNIAHTQLRIGWDKRYLGWRFQFDSRKPWRTDDGKDWWTQTEGNFLMLNLYHYTGDIAYLQKFKETSWFWDKYLIDYKYGECFTAAAPDGRKSRTKKGDLYKSMYHTMEHSLFNYLYLSFYVKHRDAELFFCLTSDYHGEKHLVKPVEDKNIILKKVEIDGRDWKSFNANECAVFLPKGKNMKVRVILGVK